MEVAGPLGTPLGLAQRTLLLSALVTLSGLCTASSSSRPQCQALQSPQTPSPGKPQTGSLLSAQVAKRKGTGALTPPGAFTLHPPPWGPHPRCSRWAPNAAIQTNFPRQQSEAHPRLSSHSHAKPRKIFNKRHPPSTSWGQGSYSVVPSVLARAPAQRCLSYSSAQSPGVRSIPCTLGSQ